MNRLLLSYFFFLLIIFVNLFHPQFISQFGLSDFTYLSFVAIHFVTVAFGCFSLVFDFSVGVGGFVIGLSQIFYFFSLPHFG